MYDIILSTPALSIGWIEITSAITVIVFIAMVINRFNTKLSKKTYYTNEEKRDNHIERIKIELEKEIDCFKQENMGSHAKLSAESDKYFELVRDELKQDRENFIHQINLVNGNIQNLINLVRKNGK